MRKALLILLLLVCIAQPALAQEYVAPEAPDHVQDLLPPDRDSLAEGLWYVVRSAIGLLRPDLREAFVYCLMVLATVLLLSVLRSFEGQGKAAVDLCGVVAIGCILLKPANVLIALAADTILEMSEYGKLLLPVITGAVAAQGGAVTSANLYAVTAVFNMVLSQAVSRLLVPMVYIYLALALVNGAVGDDLLKKLRDLIKWLMTWGLKLVLYAFTAYTSITGVISGTTDQAALKATKLTISGMVPVVGGILSDASETILLSAGMVKNAVGIYGLLAILAIAVGPFFRIGLQYLLLKLTGAVCGVFSDKKITGTLEDISCAMGLLLAMTGTMCLMLLICIVCFLKGAG